MTNNGSIKDMTGFEFLQVFSNPSLRSEYYSENPNLVHFSKKRFLDPITINGVMGHPKPTIAFHNCTFIEHVNFSDDKFQKTYLFFDCTFEKNIHFEGGKFNNLIEFRNGLINGVLSVEGGEFGEIHIALNCNKLEIIRGQFDNLEINPIAIPGTSNLKINECTINFSETTGNIHIGDYQIDKLKLRGTVNKDTDFTINEIIYEDFNFYKFSNNGKIKVSDIKVNPSAPPTRTWMTILRSNLGKTEFVNIDLREIDTIFIHSSYLIDCLFVNVSWPDRITIEEKNPTEENLLDQKETYRQLKYSYSKQGDSVLEHRFHGLEMDKYLEYLTVFNKSKKKIDKAKRWEIWQTLAVLKLSKWTSNYGQSLLRPLGTMLCLGLPLFTLAIMIGGVKEYSFSLHHFSFMEMLNTFPGFLSFLNPLRKYDISDANWGLIPDFMMRIVSSYCIYNFIRASRRFVK